MEHKKAQVAIEFMIIIGAIFFFIAIFFLAVQENLNDKIKEEERLLVKEVALTVQDEINLALESTNGYKRDFKLPSNIRQLDYEINITSNVVYIRTEDNKHAMALPVANVTGEINITDNTIEKINGGIYINQWKLRKPKHGA